MKQADCELAGFGLFNLARIEPINDCTDRIRECMDKRMTRNKARQHLDISFSLLTRLIKIYEIPYPLAVC